MKTIRQSYKVKASVEDVWRALTDPEIIQKWGGGPAKMSGEVEFEFSLWGGDIYGKNIESVANKLLIQEWFAGNWAKPSIVTFTLTPGEKTTRIELFQENIPDDEAESIDDGWKKYYMLPLKKLLEGGDKF